MPRLHSTGLGRDAIASVRFGLGCAGGGSEPGAAAGSGRAAAGWGAPAAPGCSSAPAPLVAVPTDGTGNRTNAYFSFLVFFQAGMY